MSTGLVENQAPAQGRGIAGAVGKLTDTTGSHSSSQSCPQLFLGCDSPECPGEGGQAGAEGFLLRSSASLAFRRFVSSGSGLVLLGSAQAPPGAEQPQRVLIPQGQFPWTGHFPWRGYFPWLSLWWLIPAGHFPWMSQLWLIPEAHFPWLGTFPTVGDISHGCPRGGRRGAHSLFPLVVPGVGGEGQGCAVGWDWGGGLWWL